MPFRSVSLPDTCLPSLPNAYTSSSPLYIHLPSQPHPYLHTMSERTPLLSGSVNGPRIPSQRDVENALPSKESRIRVAEAAGALQAGKLPYVFFATIRLPY